MSCMIYFWLYKKGKGFFGLIFFKLVYRFVNCLILSVLIEIIIIDKLNLDFSWKKSLRIGLFILDYLMLY